MKTRALTLTLLALLQTGCGAATLGAASARTGAAAAKNAPAATLPLGGPLRLVASAAVDIEAPRLSPDGSLLTYVVDEDMEVPGAIKKVVGVDPMTPVERTTAWLTGVELGRAVPGKKFAGRTFKNVVEPSFTPDGKALIYCVQKHLPVLTRGKKLEEMRLDQYDIATGKVVTVYDGPLSMLHPMYSPDGTKVATYSRNLPGQQGLYVLDLAKPGGAPVRVTSADDKHPVWSADGKSLFFHSQAGGDSQTGTGDAESAWIGRVDVSDLAHPKRTMLDEAKPGIYHKHPTPMPGTDLVVYHASSTDSGNWLEVMNTRTGKRAKLGVAGLSIKGKPLASFKHPQFSDDGRQLVLVARPEKPKDAKPGTTEPYAVYLLDGADRIKSFK